jgi:hypothetical protein
MGDFLGFVLRRNQEFVIGLRIGCYSLHGVGCNCWAQRFSGVLVDC